MRLAKDRLRVFFRSSLQFFRYFLHGNVTHKGRPTPEKVIIFGEVDGFA